MIRDLLADRGPELAFFYHLVAGAGDECILLIEAESGLGKSTLLREFERRCPAGVACVTVDFKDDLGLADVFYLLGRGLGAASLRCFNDRVAQFLRPEQVVIERNVLVGRAEIQVALSTTDEETRQFRRAALTDALCNDLAALGRRVVLVFDTLNAAAPETRDWLLGPFLGHVRHCADVVAVVAGRPPLEERTTWAARCRRIHLCGISEPEEWRAGLLALDLSLTLETIQAYCVLYDGHPLHVGMALDKFIRAGRRGGGR